MSGSDNDSDDDDGGWLGKLIKAFQKKADDPKKQDDPITSFFQSLLTFFKQLAHPDVDAPNFDDGLNPQAPRQEYTEGKQGDFNQSVNSYFKPGQWFSSGNIAKIPEALLKMRERIDPTDDHHVQAIMPVVGNVRISSGFGHRESPTEGASTEHKGLDIAPEVAGTNLTIVAPMPGMVVGAGWKQGYGNMVEIMDIYGERHRFGHLKSFTVKIGDTVDQGQAMAVMGQTGRATGVHLHYEQRDAKGNVRSPEIMGHTLAEGQHIRLDQEQANQRLAALDLSSLQDRSSQYVPPVGSNSQQTPQVPGHSRA